MPNRINIPGPEFSSDPNFNRHILSDTAVSSMLQTLGHAWDMYTRRNENKTLKYFEKYEEVIKQIIFLQDRIKLSKITQEEADNLKTEYLDLLGKIKN
jgi:hypothetical protein